MVFISGIVDDAWSCLLLPLSTTCLLFAVFLQVVGVCGTWGGDGWAWVGTLLGPEGSGWLHAYRHVSVGCVGFFWLFLPVFWVASFALPSALWGVGGCVGGFVV